MAYDVALKSDPTPMPLRPAILILTHKRKRAVFISYTSNARGRAAVLASMIRHRKKTKRNHLKDLPEGDIRDFELLAVNIGLEKTKGDATVERYQRKFEKSGFRLFGGPRSAVPLIAVNGKRMSLVEAMAAYKVKEGYQTVYRRIQRGWPVQAGVWDWRIANEPKNRTSRSCWRIWNDRCPSKKARRSASPSITVPVSGRSRSAATTGCAIT